MPTDTPSCWNCGKPLEDLPRPVSRHEYCPHCAEPVHCCRMCVHFAPTLAGQCREDRAEAPVDKTAANFCDFFILPEMADDTASRDGDAARARLEALFGRAGGGDAESPAASGAAGDDHDDRQVRARNRLDELFARDPDEG